MIDTDSTVGIGLEKSNEQAGRDLRDRMDDLRARNEELMEAMEQTRVDVTDSENANKKS